MTTFLATERLRQAEFKAISPSFSDPARKDGSYGRLAHPFCVPSDLSLENLYPPIREDALAYFTRNKIKWHRAIDGRPSNHLCDSQVACVNFLLPLASNPTALMKVLSSAVPDAVGISPIEDGLYVSFEYIGQENYLGEKTSGRATRSRGANATSADAAVLYRKSDGSTHMCLIEWKYTEAYGPGTLRYSKSGTDRFGIYAAHLQSPTSPIRLPPSISFDALFYDPFDQLMRQQLLAHSIEAARERGVESVTVVHVSPRANKELPRVTSPSLMTLANSAFEVWPLLLRNPARFRSKHTETMFAPVLESPGSALSDWANYITARYSWVAGAA